MGYNSVFFVLNDQMDQIRKCPNQAIAILTNPKMGNSDSENNYRRWMIREVAAENNEPIISEQALEALPTFHASGTQYIRAGGNCIYIMEVLKYGTDKKSGKKTITLILPDWAES